MNRFTKKAFLLFIAAWPSISLMAQTAPIHAKQMNSEHRQATASTQQLDSIVEKNEDGTFAFKYEYAYHADRNKTMEAVYEWNTSTNVWVASYKDEYTYDAARNQTTNIYYDWDSSTSRGVGSDKYEIHLRCRW